MKNLEISIRSLIKNRNGFYVSEKQRDFLMEQINGNEGFIGSNNQYNGYQVFAECDELGITKLYHKTNKNKNTNVKFERKGSDWNPVKIKVKTETYKKLVIEKAEELHKAQTPIYELQRLLESIGEHDEAKKLDSTLEVLFDAHKEIVKWRKTFWDD